MFGDIGFTCHDYDMQYFYLIGIINIYMLPKQPPPYYLSLVSQLSIMKIRKATQPSLRVSRRPESELHS